MENNVVPKPTAYCDDISVDNLVWFAPLQAKGVAYGACFLAVFGTKNQKLKSLIGIPRTVRKKMFCRQDLISHCDAFADGRTRRFLDIFDCCDEMTIECPAAILRYYEKTTYDFSEKESVWAFWVNDFSPDKSIVFAEFVCGGYTELTEDMVNTARDKYLAKFHSLYEMINLPGSLLDFTYKMGYDNLGNADSIAKNIRCVLGKEISMKQRRALQKEFLDWSHVPIQEHHLASAYVLTAIRNHFVHAINATYYVSLFMSHARCLYHAFMQRLGQDGSHNAGRAILAAMQDGGAIHCDQAYRITNNKDAENWLDTTLHIYCLRLAFDAFGTISSSSYRFKKSLSYVSFCTIPTQSLHFADTELTRFCNDMIRYAIIPFYVGEDMMALGFNFQDVALLHLSCSR